MSTKSKFCSGCGTPLEEKNRFCPTCGMKVINEDEHNQEKPSIKKAPSPREKPVESIREQDSTSIKDTGSGNSILWISLGMVVFILSITGTYVYLDKQNQMTKTKALPSSITNKYVIPSEDSCKRNGGKIYRNGICKSTLQNAQKICIENKSRLATINELENLVTSCGGRINQDNKDNFAYQQCYKEKGFVDELDYWSSSITEISDLPRLLNISLGAVYTAGKLTSHSVICRSK